MDGPCPCDCPVRYQAPRLAVSCGQANASAYIMFMGLVETYIRLRCDIEEPCRQVPAQPNSKSHYDFLILGGGVAGSMLAYRLSEVAQFSVLLIEAGDLPATYTRVPGLYPASIFGPADWKYFGNPQTNCFGSSGGVPFFPRGKMLGGSGCMNAMNYQRGAHPDLDNINRDFNLTHWSFKDCLPYFIKSEDNQNINVVDEGYHGVGGPQKISLMPYLPPLTFDILKAATELGYPVVDTNGASHFGFTIGQTFTWEGKRYSPVDSFIRPVLNRKNLHILLNTTVAKINLEGNKAVSVDVIYSDGTKDTIFANNEVLIAAGTVGSPQLLQLSGIGPKAVLTKAGVPVIIELDGIGENYHDHVRSNIQFTIDETATDPMSFASLTHYLAVSGGPLTGTGIHSLTGFMNTKFADPKENGRHPDGQLMFMAYLPTCSKTGNIDELESSAGPDGKRRVNIWTVNVQPKSRGAIRIRNNDINTPPEIDAKYLTHEDDIKVVIEVMKEGLKLVTMPSLKKYNFTFLNNAAGCEKFDLQSQTDQYLECHARYFTFGENHMVGTCRMGDKSDKMAVVDKYLRVIGVTNLRVCDASVLPRITTSNTHAPTMMIAERAADFIKQSWVNSNGGDDDDDNWHHKDYKNPFDRLNPFGGSGNGGWWGR